MSWICMKMNMQWNYKKKTELIYTNHIDINFSFENEKEVIFRPFPTSVSIQAWCKIFYVRMRLICLKINMEKDQLQVSIYTRPKLT